MSMEFEYTCMPFELTPGENAASGAERLGMEGWELLSAPKVCSDRPGFWVDLRRQRGSNSPSGWEYHVFDLADKPPGWYPHLQGCGWIELAPPLAKAYSHACLFKRPPHFRGTDDGDIEQRLDDMGFTRYESACFYHYWGPPSALDAVLTIKWNESQAQGKNIGTYQAVKLWLAHTYLPYIFRTHGIDLPTIPPEDLLDLLLGLRQRLREHAHVPSLAQTVQLWGAGVKQECEPSKS